MILRKDKQSDIALYYEVHGKGAPLLLIAGVGSDVSSWARVVKKLSKQFKVIAFDNRGTGRSETSKGRYAICDMAGDAVRLLDHLNIKKANVLGHSMGGYIAQELAINYPGYVNKLILVSCGPVTTKRNNVLFLSFYNELCKGKDPAKWVRRWAGWLFSKKCLKNKRFIDAFVKFGANYKYAQKASGLKGQVEAVRSFDTLKRLSKIKAKTLVLEGKEDILIPPKEAKALAKNIPGSIYQPLKGVAHCIHIEHPAEFLKAVSNF